MSKRVLSLIIMLAAVLSVALAITWPRKIIPTSGVIAEAGLSVYWEETCTMQVVSIDWGIMRPGSWSNKTVFIRNEGNIPLNVSVVTANWSDGQTYFAFLAENFTLPVEQIHPTTWHLYVATNIIGIETFSFDIYVNGD